MATETFGAFNAGGQFSQSLYNFANQGEGNMNAITDAARQAGAGISLAFSSLGTAFQPMLNGFNSVMDILGARTDSFGIQFREVLSLIDEVSNLAIGITRAAERTRQGWENAKGWWNGKPAGQVQFTPWADSAGQYDRDRQYSDARVQDASMARDMARFALKLDKAGRLVGIGAPAGGTGVLRAAPGTGDDKKGGTGEVGRTLSGSELDRRLASIGARITSRERTAEQQRSLIARWEREDPRTRGIRPADPTKSAHVVGNGGLARDIAKGRGVSLASITAAVGKQNIKQLLDEGDHFHLAVKGKGGAGGAQKSDAEREAERLADRVAEFWKNIEGDSRDAELTYEALSRASREGKVLGTYSADTAKQLEYQRLIGREITADERTRIELAQQAQRTNQFLTSSLVQEDARKRDLLVEQAGLANKIAGLTESQQQVERGVLEFRLEAMAKGVPLADQAYQAAESKLRLDLASGEAIRAQNRAYDEQIEKIRAAAEGARAALGTHGTRDDRRESARDDYEREMDLLWQARRTGREHGKA